MGRVLQHIVRRIGAAVCHFLDLSVDGDHRITEAVELFLRLAFGGLDHQGAGHREGDGRGMEAVIHQALGDIFHLDAGELLERPAVEDHFMGVAPILAAIEHREVFLQAGFNVIGIQDGVAGGVGHPVTTEHLDVGVGDQQDAGAAPAGGRYRVHCLGAGIRTDHVAGQIRRQVFGHADRPHAGTAAAVGNAEGLVQVKMADIRPDDPGMGQSHLGIEVGAIHINLSAVLVNDPADFLDALFKYPVGGRIGNHQCCQPLFVLGGFRLQIVEVDVAMLVAFDDHHLHAGHDCAGRVGAVGGGRNQGNIAVAFTTAFQVSADHHHTGKLSLSPGIGLQRNRGKAGQLAEHRLQFTENPGISPGLIFRHKGMQPPEGLPTDRHHLGRSVQLHGAGAEGDHRGG